MEVELVKLFAQIASESLKKLPSYDEAQWKKLSEMLDDLSKELLKPTWHPDINERMDPRIVVNLKGKIHAFAKNIIANLDS